MVSAHIKTKFIAKCRSMVEESPKQVFVDVVQTTDGIRLDIEGYTIVKLEDKGTLLLYSSADYCKAFEGDEHGCIKTRIDNARRT